MSGRVPLIITPFLNSHSGSSARWDMAWGAEGGPLKSCMDHSTQCGLLGAEEVPLSRALSPLTSRGWGAKMRAYLVQEH